MGEVTSKIAVIFNGSSENSSRNDVESGLRVFSQTGYTSFVVSPQRPLGPHASYKKNSAENIEDLIGSLGSNKQTDIVFLIVGHGERDAIGRGTLCLNEQMECSWGGLIDLLDGIPYRQRTVIIHPCRSGNWRSTFVDDPRTLFMSSGVEDEITWSDCDKGHASFWFKDPEQKNTDQEIDWRRRYESLVGDKKYWCSNPQFVMTPGYRLSAPAPFPKRIQSVQSWGGLQRKLKILKPGQYAIVSSTRKKDIVAAAAKGEGQHLFILVPEKVSPGTRIFFHQGLGLVELPVWESRDLLWEIGRFSLRKALLRYSRSEAIGYQSVRLYERLMREDDLTSREVLKGVHVLALYSQKRGLAGKLARRLLPKIQAKAAFEREIQKELRKIEGQK